MTNNLTARVIVGLDVQDGRVVKGVNFVNKRDAGDPVELAIQYNAEGADELVFLDIMASAEGKGTMIDVVRRTADQVFIPLTVGGGIRNVEDMRRILAAGADKIFINTAAIANPQLITDGADVFGTQCITVAVDAKRREDENIWDVYSHGGRTLTDRELISWVREIQERGGGEVLLTSMNRDGTQSGYDLAQLEAVSSQVNIPLIASGGAGTLEHLSDALQPGRADAVFAASIFHFGKYRIRDVKEHLRDQGIPVRLESGS